jgi:hypothetical protein
MTEPTAAPQPWSRKRGDGAAALRSKVLRRVPNAELIKGVRVQVGQVSYDELSIEDIGYHPIPDHPGVCILIRSLHPVAKLVCFEDVLLLRRGAADRRAFAQGSRPLLSGR